MYLYVLGWCCNDNVGVFFIEAAAQRGEVETETYRYTEDSLEMKRSIYRQRTKDR